MTTPNRTLALLLETINEVRLALAYVPKLCSERKYQEALDVIDECRVQLAEVDSAAADVWVLEGGQALLEVDAALSSAESFSRHQALLVMHLATRPLTLADARPGQDPDIGFADVPLF